MSIDPSILFESYSLKRIYNVMLEQENEETENEDIELQNAKDKKRRMATGAAIGASLAGLDIGVSTISDKKRLMDAYGDIKQKYGSRGRNIFIATAVVVPALAIAMSAGLGAGIGWLVHKLKKKKASNAEIKDAVSKLKSEYTKKKDQENNKE